MILKAKLKKIAPAYVQEAIKNKFDNQARDRERRGEPVPEVETTHGWVRYKGDYYEIQQQGAEIKTA